MADEQTGVQNEPVGNVDDAICPKCHKGFSSQYELQRHLNRKTPCDAGKEICTGCDGTFSDKKTLNTHLRLKRCKGKHAVVIAKEQAEKLVNLQQQVQTQEELMNAVKEVATAAQHQLPVVISQPSVAVKKQPVVSPEFVYAVWSNSNRTIKAGYWKGSLKALRQRYVSILGKNMQVMLFHCVNRILTERHVFEKLKPWHIESELYKMECLHMLPMLILSVSSVSDSVQRSEHTEGGYLFTRPQIQDAEIELSTTAPLKLTEEKLLKVRQKQLELKQQAEDLRHQQLALREQELGLREQELKLREEELALREDLFNAERSSLV